MKLSKAKQLTSEVIRHVLRCFWEALETVQVAEYVVHVYIVCFTHTLMVLITLTTCSKACIKLSNYPCKSKLVDKMINWQTEQLSTRV